MRDVCAKWMTSRLCWDGMRKEGLTSGRGVIRGETARLKEGQKEKMSMKTVVVRGDEKGDDKTRGLMVGGCGERSGVVWGVWW